MTASRRTDSDIGDDKVSEWPHRAHTFEPTNEPGKFELGGSEKALPEDAGLYPEQGVRWRCVTG